MEIVIYLSTFPLDCGCISNDSNPNLAAFCVIIFMKVVFAKMDYDFELFSNVLRSLSFNDFY